MNNQSLTVGQIAELLNKQMGIAAEVQGDPELRIEDIKPLKSAQAQHLSFVANLDARHAHRRDEASALLELAKNTKAGALLIPEYVADFSAVQIITPNPMAAIIALASALHKTPLPAEGIHPQASVHDSVQLGENTCVGPFAVLSEGVSLGNNVIIHPHVVLYPQASIGNNCVIHAGAVIRENVVIGDDCIIQNGVVVGSDGFGYIPDKKLGHRRIPHVGNVILKKGVDIGANSTIDRATLGETCIGENTKVDNLVMLAHNVKIGERSLLCGQAGVSGSSSVGSDVILAGQVGVADHVNIGDKVRAAGKTGIGRDVPSNTDVAGAPHSEAGTWRRTTLLLPKLPEVMRRLRRIEKKLDD